MGLLVRVVRALHEASETIYDTVYNLPTRGHLLKSQTGVAHEDASEYAATPYRVIRRLFRQLPSRCRHGAFVDYGCGRGRVAIMAARFPFRRVYGVELSQALCRQARENLRVSRVQKVAEVEFIQADAAQFTVPDDTSVVFWYRPFGEQTTTEVLAQLRLSLEKKPRELWLLAYNASLLIDLAVSQLSAEVVCRRNTIYPTIEWAVLRVPTGPTTS